MKALVFAIIVAGAALSAAILYSTGFFQSAESAVVQAVQAELADGESAEFRNVRRGSVDGMWCGEVIVQSGFGGSSGWTEFRAAEPSAAAPQWRVFFLTRNIAARMPPCDR